MCYEALREGYNMLEHHFVCFDKLLPPGFLLCVSEDEWMHVLNKKKEINQQHLFKHKIGTY